MDSNELLTTLADLKKNRRIASEVTPLIDPLRGQSYNLKLIFASASRTFGHNFGSKYDNGYTVLCKTAEGEVEVSVMFPERTNSSIEKMEAGHTFEAEITLLDFDALYQRAILGCAAEELATIDDTPEADEAPGVEEMPAAEEKTMKTSAMEEEVWGADPDPKTPANRKFRAIAFVTVSFLAVLYAASQWLEIDSGIGWITWAVLVYPLGLGLPCIANRSWICLFLALAAFVFEITGTLLFYNDEIFFAGGVAMNCYHIALTLQAMALLGLAFALNRKTGSRWCLIMALLFAGCNYLLIQSNYSEFDLITVDQLNQAFAFLVALSFSSWAIIRHEMKLGAEESS